MEVELRDEERSDELESALFFFYCHFSGSLRSPSPLKNRRRRILHIQAPGERRLLTLNLRPTLLHNLPLLTQIQTHHI